MKHRLKTTVTENATKIQQYKLSRTSDVLYLYPLIWLFQHSNLVRLKRIKTQLALAASGSAFADSSTHTRIENIWEKNPRKGVP